MSGLQLAQLPADVLVDIFVRGGHALLRTCRDFHAAWDALVFRSPATLARLLQNLQKDNKHHKNRHSLDAALVRWMGAPFLTDDARCRILRALLQAGASVARASVFGRPLFHACAAGHAEGARLLIEAGADIRREYRRIMRWRRDKPKTALEVAADNGHDRVVELLLDIRGLGSEDCIRAIPVVFRRITSDPDRQLRVAHVLWDRMGPIARDAAANDLLCHAFEFRRCCVPLMLRMMLDAKHDVEVRRTDRFKGTLLRAIARRDLEAFKTLMERCQFSDASLHEARSRAIHFPESPCRTEIEMEIFGILLKALPGPSPSEGLGGSNLETAVFFQ